MKEHRTKPRALVVDDEPDLLELLEFTLTGMGVIVSTATTIAKARQLLLASQPDFCITDMRLPDGSGMELVEAIGKMGKPIPVAVVTAYGSVETAVEAMKLGAFDFISKPIELNELRRLADTALQLTGYAAEPETSSAGDCFRGELLGETEVMRELRSKIDRLARTQAPVHIRGESGTGKELVARLIHEKGVRSDAPFVPVNCGAIPPDLVESEFFGYKKGGFTGATGDRKGLFQAAAGGTLFLDEISELPPPMQVKLLRALQEKAVRPVGGHAEIPVDVRVLSASNTDLREMVSRGSFREDLFYRVNVIELLVPPLRQRRADIPLLVMHVTRRLAERNGFPVPSYSDEALGILQDYAYPGNVRELENLLERAMTWMEAGEVQARDLALPEAQGGGEAHQPGNNHAQPVKDAAASVDAGQDIQAVLESQEREMISRALEETRWNRTAAALRLGISFRALRYRIKKLGLE